MCCYYQFSFLLCSLKMPIRSWSSYALGWQDFVDKGAVMGDSFTRMTTISSNGFNQSPSKSTLQGFEHSVCQTSAYSE